LGEENRGATAGAPEALTQGLPAPLRGALERLGGRPNAADLRSVIVQLCELRWWTPKELADVLQRRDASHLSEKHLSPLVKEGKLERRYPDNLAHPQQAYRARQSSLLNAADERRGAD